MLDIAKEKIYDELLTGDICNILKKAPKYNLFIVADVLYI